MKKRFLSFSMAVCMVCLLTMTSCSAAEIPAASGGTGMDNAKLTSEAQPVSASSDVPAGAWYAEAIAYCQQNGIMSGTNDTTFAPEATLTRAMLATVLHRMINTPIVSDPPYHPGAGSHHFMALCGEFGPRNSFTLLRWRFRFQLGTGGSPMGKRGRYSGGNDSK